MRTISEREIRRRLSGHYCHHHREPPFERDLVRTEVVNSHGQVGCVLYSLNGSPPKGYALFIPELRLLSFYDNMGKRFCKMDQVLEVVP